MVLVTRFSVGVCCAVCRVVLCRVLCRTDMGTEVAERSAEEGADSVLYPWLNWSPSLNGSFTRDGTQLEW